MNHTPPTNVAQSATPSRLQAHGLGLLLLAAGAWFATNPAQAQSPAESAPASAAIPKAVPAAVSAATTAVVPTAPAPVAAAKTPRYSDQDVERAFSFMDKNRDRKVSRDEASNFRGVSKYFDRADTDKDSHLSPEEFKQALNKS